MLGLQLNYVSKSGPRSVVPEAGIKEGHVNAPTETAGCNNLSQPLKPASGTIPLICVLLLNRREILLHRFRPIRLYRAVDEYTHGVALSCFASCVKFMHVLQGCFTDSGVMLWFTQCSWSNTEGPG